MPTFAFSQTPYAGHGDLAELRAFLMRVRSRFPPGCSPVDHVGDLVWQSHQNLHVDPHRDVQVWRARDGAVVGYTLANRPNGMEFQIDDQAWDSGLPEQMLAGALEDHADYVRDSVEARPISSSALETDARKRALLEANGFVTDGYLLHVMTRDLGMPVPGPRLPAGYEACDMAGNARLAERVDAHREVWQPSRFTLEGYDRLRRTPGYDPTLDLALLFEGRQIASYCIMWLDEINQIAEFEPVGTRAAHRRLGLGRELLYEGMRRMRSRGMSHALVYCMPAARGFYASAGFTESGRYLGYVRPAIV